MANTVNYASMYLKTLDKIFKKEACTALFEMGGTDKVRPDTVNAKNIYLRKISVDGLGDYSRTSGFVDGDATITWENHALTQERGRKFNLDAMDSVEAYTTIMEVAAEFQRTKVVPEVDAYRFAKIYSLCGSNTTGTLTYDDVIAAIDNGIAALDDLEVPEMGRALFVSNSVYQSMKQSGDTFKVRMANGINRILDRDIEYFDKMPLIKVPSGRFNTSITTYDGSTGGQTAGGYVTAGYDINFMIVPISLVAGVVKYVKPGIISPDDNQSADSWIYKHRLYHDLFIADNKVDGVYIHNKAS
jgi:hypothetical protein